MVHRHDYYAHGNVLVSALLFCIAECAVHRHDYYAHGNVLVSALLFA